MSNPTRKDNGVGDSAPMAPIMIVIAFDPNTGNCQVKAPSDAVAFYGIMRLAEKVFEKMIDQHLHSAAERPRIVVPKM